MDPVGISENDSRYLDDARIMGGMLFSAVPGQHAYYRYEGAGFKCSACWNGARLTVLKE